MKCFLLILLFLPFTHAQEVETIRIPLLREGTKIIEGRGTLSRLSEKHPIVIQLPRDEHRSVDSFIVLPNQRLAEMEASSKRYPDRSFRVSGDVFAYGNQNYLLVREAVTLGEHADRIQPTTVPIDPNSDIIEKEDFEDSVADIVKDLQESSGTLVRSIRNASDFPITDSSVKEGDRITSRRCHLVRNNFGAWIAVFVSDATGLQDPPCTILPSVSFAELTRWASERIPSTPVLLSGELLSYHGHGFLVVNTWRPVHNTDHLGE